MAFLQDKLNNCFYERGRGLEMIFVFIEICLRAELTLMWRIYASVNYVIIGLNNCLSPIRHQAIIWNNAGLLSIGS